MQQKQSSSYNINQLVALSATLQTLQMRLLTTLQILKYINNAESKESIYQWVFEPSGFIIKKPEGIVILSDEMEQTLSNLHPMANSEPNKGYYQNDVIRQLNAVITYMICFGSNPYLGQLYYDKVVISHDWERDYWGKNRIFSYSDDSRNRPDGYYQIRTIELWTSLQKTELAAKLKEYFDGLVENSSVDILSLIYDTLSNLNTAPKSDKKMYLKDGSDTVFLLVDGKYLLDSDYNIIGKATLKVSNGRTDLHLTNETNEVWELTTASGKSKDVQSGDSMPVRSGMAIKIPKIGTSWIVEEVKQNINQTISK